jgi:hypothetical protein
VFIITDNRKPVGEEVKGVGVMKDEDLKFEEIEVSLTLVDLEVVDATLLSDTVVILCLL